MFGKFLPPWLPPINPVWTNSDPSCNRICCRVCTAMLNWDFGVKCGSWLTLGLGLAQSQRKKNGTSSVTQIAYKHNNCAREFLGGDVT